MEVLGLFTGPLTSKFDPHLDLDGDSVSYGPVLTFVLASRPRLWQSKRYGRFQITKSIDFMKYANEHKRTLD